MTFERPGAWALLALAVPIVIAFLRFRRRREVEVPSLVVWLDVAPPGVGRRGFRRVEDALQLAALLVALGAFAAALAGPVLGTPPDASRRLIVVLDVSASMNARSGAGSRFDEARAAADLAIAKLAKGDAVVVWAAAAAPRVVVEPTTDHAAARAALATVAPTLERGGVRRTLDFARLAAGRDGSAMVLVLTDAPGLVELRDVDAGPSLSIGVAGAGERDVRNAAIVAADVDAEGERHLRVRVARTDGTAGRRTLVLLRDGVEKARSDVDVPEMGAAEAVLPLDAFAPSGGLAEVRLLPADDSAPDGFAPDSFAPDSFAPDDVVAFVVPAPRAIRVALVAPGMTPSPFLREALRAMADRLDASHAVVTHPDALAGTFASSDVLVVEDVLPPAPPRDRATLLFGAPGRAVERPIVWSVGAHPVLDGVDLAPLRIDRANVLEPAPGERVLIECAEGPVAVAGDGEGGARRVRLGFRPDATTLPLEAAFPVLVRNAVAWLARPPLLPWSVRGGAPIATSERLPDVERLWFIGPGDVAPRRVTVVDGAIAEPAPLPPPAGPRVMTVRGLPGDPATAVNWFAPDGFRLAPPPPPDGVAAAASATRSPAAAAAALPDRAGNTDTRVRLAGWLAALGAAALVAASLRRAGAAPGELDAVPVAA